MALTWETITEGDTLPTLGKRPGVQKGMAVGASLSVDVTKLPPEEQARIRKIMYNQRAIPVKD